MKPIRSSFLACIALAGCDFETAEVKSCKEANMYSAVQCECVVREARNGMDAITYARWSDMMARRSDPRALARMYEQDPKLFARIGEQVAQAEKSCGV